MVQSQLTFSQNGIEQKIKSEQIGAVSTLLNNLNDDKKITPFEKIQLLQEWEKISSGYEVMQHEYEIYDIAETEQALNLSEIYSDINDILFVNANAPLLDMETTTDIDIETLRVLFVRYYTQETTVKNQISNKINEVSVAANMSATEAKETADNAQATADVTVETLLDFASDTVMTPLEKISVRKEWLVIEGEKATLLEQAGSYGLSTTAYSSAFNSLQTYLYGEKGVLNDMNSNNPITPSIFQGHITKYYGAKTTLLKQITDSAKTLNDNAMIEIGKKSLVFTQSTQPTAKTENDIWYKTASTDATKIIGVYIWNGTAWIEKKLDAASFSVGELSAITSVLGHVTAGSITGTVINGSEINSTDSDGNMTVKGSSIELDSTSLEDFNKGYASFSPRGTVIQGVTARGSLQNNITKANFNKLEEINYGAVEKNGETFEDFPLYSDFMEVRLGDISFGRKNENIWDANGNYGKISHYGTVFISGADFSFQGEVKAKSFKTEGKVSLNANSIAVGGEFNQEAVKIEYVSIGTQTVYSPTIKTKGVYIDNEKLVIDSGKTSITPTAASTPTKLSIKFNKKFSVPPTVLTNCGSTVIGTTVLGTCASNISETGCDLYLTRTNTTTTVVNWVAYGS